MVYNHSFNRLLLSIITVFFSSMLVQAQVTIGSSEPPVKGALLQLKNIEGVAGAGANASGGLAVPRVKLTNEENLYPMFEATPGSNTPSDKYNSTLKPQVDKEHIGLIVYHTEPCSMFGKGLYLWSGQKWDKLGQRNPGGLHFTPETVYLGSGWDWQSTDATIDINWGPSGTGVTPPTWMYERGFLKENEITILPASGSFSTTSPQKMTIKVAAFDKPEHGGGDFNNNPFMSKDGKINFMFGACGNQVKTLSINQTNKAVLLKVPGTLNSTGTPYPLVTILRGPTDERKIDLEIVSNAQYKVRVDPFKNPAVIEVSPKDGDIIGSEYYDGTSFSSTPLSFRAVYKDPPFLPFSSSITFSDTQTPKRFPDAVKYVTVCYGVPDAHKPPIAEQPLDIFQDFLGTAKDVPNADGVAWHLDHEGHTFLSGDFGDAGRWMTTNLALTTYDERTDGSAKPSLALNNRLPVDAGTAVYTYPIQEGAPTDGTYAEHYKIRNRLGLLYNWQAATGGENTSMVDQVETSAEAYKYVQGICPKGWHLPTLAEWRDLVEEVSTKGYKYATDPSVNRKDQWYIDICEYTQGIEDSDYANTSIAYYKGGMAFVNAGYIENGKDGHIVQNVGYTTIMATSSTNGNFGEGYFMYNRNLMATAMGAGTIPQVKYPGPFNSQFPFSYPGTNDRTVSVRCKKD